MSERVKIDLLQRVRKAGCIKVEEEIDRRTYTFVSMLHEVEIIGRRNSVRAVDCRIPFSGQAVRSRFADAVRIHALNTVCTRFCYEGRVAVPMTVLQPGSEGVQSAVIVYGKLPAIVILVIEQMSVSVKQSFDFENLLQLVKVLLSLSSFPAYCLFRSVKVFA